MLSNSEEMAEYQQLALKERAAKDQAYKERNLLLSLITKVIPCDSWLERHPDADTTWENDWRWIVFIELPTGQASWHIHDSELPLFKHLGRRVYQVPGEKPSWDGHTTEEKYQRVMDVPVITSFRWVEFEAERKEQKPIAVIPAWSRNKKPNFQPLPDE